MGFFPPSWFAGTAKENSESYHRHCELVNLLVTKLLFILPSK